MWLQTQGERRVTIPYAPKLAELVPSRAVRLRRDFGAVISLIKAHAILHQPYRKRDGFGRIVATIGDYKAVRELVKDIIAEGVGATVADSVREIVQAVETLCAEQAGKAKGDDFALSTRGVSTTNLAKHLNIHKSNVSRGIRRAADFGYVQNLEERRGRSARWVIGDPLPDQEDLLPDPTKLGGA
jgi:hypothetical protein